MSRALLTTLLAAVAATPAVGAAPAAADCPGGSDPCPYASASSVGQRGGGVLRFPQAVAVGPDGSVYVGDQSSHVVQVFGPDGSFRREVGSAGTRPGQLSAVGALAIGGDGSLLVADGGSNRVDRFDGAGALLGTFGGPGTAVGQFRFGAGGGNDAAAGGGLAAAGDTVYVVDTGNDRVLRFALDGGRGTQIVAPGTLANPRGGAVRGTRLIVADDQHHRAVVFDTGGRLLKTIGSGQGAGPGQLNFPYGVAFDRQGRVYVADDLNHRVVRYSSAATGYAYKARWGSYGAQSGQLAYPRGVATDSNGLVYVTNTGNDRIDVFDRSGMLQRSFGSSGRAPGQFNAPLGVATDAGGMRAVTDSVNGRLQLLNPDGSVATVWGSPNPGPTILPNPVAAAFDGAGNAYVLDGRRGRIVVFDRATGKPGRTIATAGRGPGQLTAPTALAIDDGATISVADSGNDRIARFSTAGSYLGATTGLDSPRGIAVTPDGSRTYVSDGRDRITAYGPDGGELAQFGGTGSKLGKLNAPRQLALDAAGRLWVADTGNNRVQQFGPDGERLQTVGTRGTADGELVHPTGVSVSCNGTLSVADTDNNRVSQFALAAPATTTCASLAPLGTPPAPRLPTLPAPLGPQVSVRVLRASGLFARNLPVRIGCDTTCQATVTVRLVQRGRPGKGKTPAQAVIAPLELTVPGGQSALVRPALTPTAAAKLRRALHGRKGLSATVSVTATAPVGTPTTVTRRLDATG